MPGGSSDEGLDAYRRGFGRLGFAVPSALATAGGDGGRLVNRAGGYLLALRPGERDIDRWQWALARARQARVDQEHLPESLRDRQYYRPVDRGLEAELGRRLAEWRRWRAEKRM